MIRIGDVIKCLDFAGNECHYMIGVVTEINHGGLQYNCKGLKRVIANEEVTPINFTTYAQGESMLDDAFPGRVTKVDPQ